MFSYYFLARQILALLADALLEVQEQVDGDDEVPTIVFDLSTFIFLAVGLIRKLWQFISQDSDWEEAQNGDAGNEEALLYSAAATSHSRPSYEYLDAMAKAFNKVYSCLTFHSFPNCADFHLIEHGFFLLG